ncbi:MAG TPA: flavin reductase family protein [Symbiobacteriaceae bacterium]|nr:flavin reductase family protein [Symbiobacteriaceae bacterium]
MTFTVMIDPGTMPWRDAYRLMIGSIVPRPIAWVSTVSKEGVRNLAPFSFFTAVAAEPMTICFSPMRRGTDGARKDTLVNIEETGEFVVNIVSESLAEAMNRTSAEFPPEVDEFQVAGLTPIASTTVKPPRVGESLVAYECRLLQVVHVGEAKAGAGALVLGIVQRLYVADQALDPDHGRIRLDVLQPIGRMAGMDYLRCTDRFTVDRPTTGR